MGPKTTKVYETLRNRLDTGTYAPGERIPSERALTEELAIGRTALRQVLTRLVYEKRLEVHDRSCYRATHTSSLERRARQPVDPATRTALLETLAADEPLVKRISG